MKKSDSTDPGGETERFMLDRLCLDGDAPLRCEVERVRVALERVAGVA